jgi:ABC-type transporter Mla MlaB component
MIFARPRGLRVVAAYARSSPTVVVRGPLAREDLPGLYARTCALLVATDAATVLCDVRGLAADAVAGEALARLALAAVRRRQRITLLNASPELLGLVAFMGLRDVLPGS